MMNSSVEGRLWLAVHLLYSNASQAFDVYQAVVLQSEHSINNQDTLAVFTKLCQVYDKIPAISTQMAFYEFEFEEIDQWKVIYKNSQKNQLALFVGILIFELKISEIAPLLKLAPEKAQFLFHQIFKKLASGSQKLRYNESIEFKKQNDSKISYLFTYENLVDYCLGQLSPEDSEKVTTGLKLYPTLQIAREEYSRIISQIQNLKVQKNRSPLQLETSDNNPKSEQVQSKSTTTATKKRNYLVFIVPAFVGVLAIALLNPLKYFGFNLAQNKTVVIHEVVKTKENISTNESENPVAGAPQKQEPAADIEVKNETLAAETNQMNSNQANTTAETKAPPVAAVVNPPVSPEKKPTAPAQAEGGLYRGTLIVDNVVSINEKIKENMKKFGATKAGEVELGWMKTAEMAYYHYTMPESNIENLQEFLKKNGRLFIKFEKHPRLVPAGNRRFIIEVKQK